MNAAELARRVGIHASYIGEWRAGKTPTRLQERTRRKLQQALGAGGAPESGDLVAYAREALARIEQDARALAEAARAAQVRLAPADPPLSPSAASIAAGLEALQTVARAPAAPPTATGRKARR